MTIFLKFIIFQKITGLDPQGGWRNTIVQIAYSLLFVSFYLLTTIFIALNFGQNLDQALYDVSVMNANSAFVLTYFHLLMNRDQFYSLLGELQNALHKSV